MADVGDTEARLKLIAELVGMELAAAETEKLRKAIADTGTAGEGAAKGLTAAATATDQLETAENEASTAATKAAAALDSVGTAALDAGQDAQKGAASVSASLDGVEAGAKAGGAALGAMGDQGAAGFQEIMGASLTFEGAAEQAIAKVNAAWKSYNNEAKITTRQLGFVAQAVEATKIAIVEAGERGQATTLEQLALYERLENELTQLTAKANQLTNATKDNAVRLQETGNRVTGLTNGIAQLGAVLGPTGAKIGFLIGNVGQLGSVMESLKDSTKGLDLNTLKLGGSTATLGIQIAAFTAVAAAATAAGLKLASANDQNAESMRGFWKSVKDVASGEIDKAKGQIAGLQTGLQSLLIATDSKEFAHALAEVAIASGRGAEGVKLYNVAVRDGLTATQAMKLAAAETTETLKFYEASTRSGAEGHRLWAEALKVSNGDAQLMAQYIAANNGLMQAAEKTTAAHTEAQKANNTAVREGIDLARIKGDEGNKLLTAEEANIARLSTAQDQLQAAENGTTDAINQQIAAMALQLAESDRHSISLGQQASQLADVLAHTENLTATERARIKEVIDLANRAETLTEAERKYAAELIKSIAAGTNAAASLKAQNDAKALLIQQTDELAKMQAALNAITAGAEIAAEQAIAAEAQLYVVKDARIGQLQFEIDQKKAENALIAAQSIGLDNLTISQNKVTGAWEDGKLSLTNLDEAQKDVAASSAQAASGIQVVGAESQKSKVHITNVAEALDKVGAPEVQERIAQLESLFERIEDRANRVTKAVTSMAAAIALAGGEADKAGT